MTQSSAIKNNDATYINNLLNLLHTPDILDSAEAKKYYRLVVAIKNIFNKFLTILRRTKNKIFNDGIWYNEAKARQLIIAYIDHPIRAQALQSQHNKIVKIYDRLVHLSKGKGTWADGIDKRLLLANDPNNDKTIKEKELFHIHADKFGNSSELEGLGPKEQNKMFDYLANYLKRINQTPHASIFYSTDLIEELTHVLHIDSKKTEENVKKIKSSFQSKKPLLISGGWTGQPSGHAIYYEIIPQSKDSATFRLYNTGAGIDEYHHRLRDNHKIKYQAYCEWKGIAREKLESVYFLEALYELKNCDNLPLDSTKTEYGVQDIYQGLKNILQPKEEISGPILPLDKELAMSPQTAGVCGWKGLMAWMRTKMLESTGNLKDYKRFKSDIKLQSLKDYVEADFQEVNPLNWRLVKKSHQTLCRALIKLYRNKVIGNTYLTEAQKVLNQIAIWIHQHKDCRYKRNIEQTPFTYTSSIKENQRIQNQHALSLPLEQMKKSQHVENIANQPCQQLFEAFNQIKLTTPHTLLNELKEVNSLSKQAWNEREDLALHKGLIQVVSNLELDKDIWEKAVLEQPQQAKALITELGKIGDFFTKSCFTIPNVHIIFPEKVYVLYKILYLQQILCHIDPTDDSSKKIRTLPHFYMSFDQTYLFLRFPDAKMHHEMQIILLSKIHDKMIQMDNHDYSTPSNNHDNQIGLKFYFRKSEIKSSFFTDLIRQQYPKIINQIAQENPSFKQLPKFSQDAHIYASSFLPNWIKAIRDTQLACYHLLTSPIGALTALDRKKDIQHLFQIQDKKEWSEVKLNLQGVTSEICTIPEVEKINKNEYLRYAGQYQNIKTTPIQQFLSFLRENQDCLKEKSLANNHVKKHKIDMSDEEFKELARLFIDSDFQLVETLAYFTKHPEKLQHTDYQTLLHIFLFKPGALKKNLKIKGFIDHLAHFVKKNYEQFLQENQIQQTVFLLKIAHQLNGFCPHHPFFSTTSAKLKVLLESPDLEGDVKSLVYAEYIAQLGHKPSLDHEEITLLLAGLVYIEENQVHSKYQEDPYTRKEVDHALVKHTKQIQTELEKGEPNQELLNQVLHLIRPSVKGKKKWEMQVKEGEFPSFSTSQNEHIFYPLLSKFISAKTPVLLPIKIRQNPLFQQLFPHIEQGFFYPGNIFGFNDQQGRPTLVHMKDDLIVIEKKLDRKNNKWFRFIPPSYFLEKVDSDIPKSLIGSREIIHHYTHWQSIETNNIYAIHPKTGQLAYLIDFELTEVKNLVNGLKLGQPSNRLTTFEDPAYIHEWYDDQNHLKKIELPRFNLSFKSNSQSDKLICQQFPTYSLNTTDHVPELGIHHHYILLQNQKGERKVILPQQQLKAPEKKEVLLPRYKIDRTLKGQQLDPHQYLIFDVQPNGNLFNKSREANLYLAQVLSTAQEYKKAAYYLEKFGKKLSAYTPQEKQILKNIADIHLVTGDQSGNGIVLQLYAEYLHIKNALSHQQKIDSVDIINLQSHYALYLRHYSHVTLFKLKPQEEIYILKTLLAQEFNAIHFLRLKELDPLAAQKLQLPPIKDSLPQEKTRSLKDFKIPIMFKENISSGKSSDVLLTRPQVELSTYFIDYYEIARDGTPDEKQRLQHSLHFLHTIENGKYDGMANFFETVLENPSAFPKRMSHPHYSYNNNRESLKERQKKLLDTAKWQKKLLDTATAQLSKKKASLSQPVNRENKDLAATFFRLDEKYSPPPFELHYTLPTLISLAEECTSKKCFHQMQTSHKKEDTSSLLNLLKTFKNNDPVQNREINRLIHDLEIHQKKEPDSFYTLKDKNLSKVMQILSKDKANDTQAIQTLEQEILTLANKKPDAAAAIAHNQLKKWGGLRKVLTLDELVVHFARQDYTDLFHRNRALTEADVNQLAEMVGRFLLHATRNQQRARAQVTVSKLQGLIAKNESSSKAYKELTNQLAQEMLSSRTFNPIEQPAYLVFEYFANIFMRAAQVEKLEQFLKEGDLNPVMEMIMGSGKSKVLLPLLGLLRADGNTLSMLIVPPALFESISQDTQHTLQAFSQTLHSLHFDRNTIFTPHSLEAILDNLTSIRQQRECLIMTSKSMQCLILKFIEKCTQHFNSSEKMQEFPIEVKLMQKILNLLSEYGYPIIDEVDLILRVLHEVTFSGGKRLSPDVHEIQLLTEIYSLLYQDPELKKLARLESDPAPDLAAPILTEYVYFEQLQEPLASKLIKCLGKMSFESQPLTQKFHQFIGNLTEQDRTHLMHYLCRDKEHIPAAQQFYDGLDEDIQNMLAFAGQQLYLLSHTLNRICEVKYGLDPNNPLDIFAIPFSATHTPNSGSQFSNPHITMDYTFQTYMKKGISPEMVENQIKLLQEKAIKEISINNRNMLFKETIAGQAFTRMTGPFNIPLFKYTPAHISTLTAHINATAARKLDFVATIILPQMEYFEKKTSCNPQNLISFSGKVGGFTGTLWNGLSMHHKLNLMAALGTDAKTLSILFKNSRNNVVSIKEGPTKEMLKQLKEQSIIYDMVCDSGGYFKEGSNSEIAHHIAAINSQESVFYNKQGEQMITKGTEEIPLAHSHQLPEERVTFLDQSHTTGADVKQKSNAVSLVTVGRDMLLRDGLQGAWRLRELDKSQRVRFVVSDEVADIIRQKLELSATYPIDLDSILAFMIANQATQQGQDNYKALIQQLTNIPQQILLSVFLNEELQPDLRLQAFNNMQSSWIKPASFSAKELYGTLPSSLPAATVIATDKQQAIAKIKELLTNMPWLEQIGITLENCLNEIDFIINRIKNNLPAALQSPSKESEDDQTVEVERENETQKETELEVQEHNQTEEIILGGIQAFRLKNYTNFQKAIIFLKNSALIIYKNLAILNSSKSPIFSLKSYLESDKELNSYADAFEGIDVTLNVLEWTHDKTDFALLGSHRTDIQHLLIENSKVIVMTQNDAQSERQSSNYYNLTLGFNDRSEKPSREALSKIVKIEFLNGVAHYNSERLKLLEEWFENEGPEKMQTLYLKHILSGYPQKAAAYADSPLQKLFSEIC